jgi:HPt (histidine-containing phosphotransfer) domain-containing protein
MKRLRQALAELEELGGETLVQEIIDLFLADAPRRLAEARAAMQQGDVRTAMRAAHSLKSSAAQLGLDSLSSQCARIEQTAKTGELPGLPPLLASAENLCAAGLNALRGAVPPAKAAA